MKKQDYQKPTMKVVKIQNRGIICQSLTGVSSNASLNYVGSDANYNSGARSRGGNSWDDEDW